MTKRLAPAAISVALLALLYWIVDPADVLQALLTASPAPLALALVLLAVAHLLGALRLGLLLPVDRRFGFGESLRLILAAAVLNLILPAKGGDLLKSAFMRGRAGLPGSLAVALVGFEKATDLLALLVWCAAGLTWSFRSDRLHMLLLAGVSVGLVAGIALLASNRLAGAAIRAAERIAPASWRGRLTALESSWQLMRSYYWRDRRSWISVALISLTIWFLHLTQIWLFARALGVALPFVAGLALAPLAILAGLLPLTLAGLGTRDAALVALFHDYMDPATGAALGLLASLRYLLPGLAGLPILPRYLRELRRSPDGGDETPDSARPGES